MHNGQCTCIRELSLQPPAMPLSQRTPTPPISCPSFIIMCTSLVGVLRHFSSTFGSVWAGSTQKYLSIICNLCIYMPCRSLNWIVNYSCLIHRQVPKLERVVSGTRYYGRCIYILDIAFSLCVANNELVCRNSLLCIKKCKRRGRLTVKRIHTQQYQREEERH